MLIPSEPAQKIIPYITLAVKGIESDESSSFELQLSGHPSRPTWSKDYLGKDKALQIYKSLNSRNQFVKIRCPIYVQPNSIKQATRSYFDIYLMKDLEDGSHRPLFIREGITIPDERISKVKGYTSVVVIEAGRLATLLGDSENPAHTEWEKNATKFKGKYKWGHSTINFVRNSVNNILKLLSQGDEEADSSILSDIFYINFPENDEDVPETRKKRKKKTPGSTVEPPIVDAPTRKPRYYKITKADGGFTVSSGNLASESLRIYTVSVAYDFVGASKKSALKKYDKNDFDFSRKKSVVISEHSGIEDIELSGNQIKFTAISSDFYLKAINFDKNRDIVVNVDSEELTNEEI